MAKRQQSIRNIKRYRRNFNGLTLVELLIGVVIGCVTMAAATVVILSHLKTTNTVIFATQIQRDLGRFGYLINSEAQESCRLQSDSAPANDTSCVPPTTSPCNGAVSTGTNFNMLIPLQVANADPVKRVVTYRYNSSSKQILRDGPRILSTGRLDTNILNNQNSGLILDGVTAFSHTVDKDCRTATLQVTMEVPTISTPPISQAFRLSVGTSEYIH